MATGSSHPNYICAGNNTNNNSVYRSIIRPCAPDLMVNKRNGWDLPTILNLTARSLSEEKLDELQVNVTIHDVSIICVTETWFKYYMDDKNLSIEGFSLERKDRCDDCTGGGVARYIMNSFMNKILSNLEEKELEVIWLKIMPKKLPRKFSCIHIACIYFTQMTEYAKMREHVITCVDGVIRKHSECGVILTGYFNQMNDSFLRTHYKFSQIVNVATRGQAILDKIRTNMNMVYSKPVTVAELGTSDHNMVLLKP